MNTKLWRVSEQRRVAVACRTSTHTLPLSFSLGPLSAADNIFNVSYNIEMKFKFKRRCAIWCEDAMRDATRQRMGNGREMETKAINSNVRHSQPRLYSNLHVSREHFHFSLSFLFSSFVRSFIRSLAMQPKSCWLILRYSNRWSFYDPQ